MYKDMIIRVLYEWRGGTKRTRAVGMRDSVVWMDARKVVSMYKEMNETWRERRILQERKEKKEWVVEVAHKATCCTGIDCSS